MLTKIRAYTGSLPRTSIEAAVGAMLAVQYGGPSGFCIGWIAAVGLHYTGQLMDKLRDWLGIKSRASATCLRDLLKPSGELGSWQHIACDCLRVGVQGAFIGAACSLMGAGGAASVCCLGWIGQYLQRLEDEAVE